MHIKLNMPVLQRHLLDENLIDTLRASLAEFQTALASVEKAIALVAEAERPVLFDAQGKLLRRISEVDRLLAGLQQTRLMN